MWYIQARMAVWLVLILDHQLYMTGWASVPICPILCLVNTSRKKIIELHAADGSETMNLIGIQPFISMAHVEQIDL